MKIVFVTIMLLVISTPVLARKDCTIHVRQYFSKNEPRMNSPEVKYTGKKLGPHSDLPYYEREIWNDTDKTLDIYEVRSGFMGMPFRYVALVHKNCKIHNLIEVANR